MSQTPYLLANVLSVLHQIHAHTTLTHAHTWQDHGTTVFDTWQLIKELSTPLELGDKFFKVRRALQARL